MLAVLLAQWVNVTGGVGGEAWGYAGVTLLAGVPGRDEILAGVSERGLWSSADAGASWTKVSELGPGGRWLRRGDAIHWTGMWGNGLITSSDGGATWAKLKAPVKSSVIEIPGKRLAGVGDKQVYVSKDDGATWEMFGEPLPIKANGLAVAGKRLYAWRMSDKKADDTVFRSEAPE